MPVRKLLDYLNNNKVRYLSIRHSKAFTAIEIAHAAHLHRKDMAKTVMVLLDGKLAMVVLPAIYQVDLDLLQEMLGVEEVKLATEKEFSETFPGCELGAMPPFGNLYGLDVYVDKTLTKNIDIVFNAGFLTELISMKYMDYESLVKPNVMKVRKKTH